IPRPKHLELPQCLRPQAAFRVAARVDSVESTRRARVRAARRTRFRWFELALRAIGERHQAALRDGTPYEAPVGCRRPGPSAFLGSGILRASRRDRFGAL